METNPKRWYDLPAALLLMAGVLAAATRLVATRWTDHLGLTQTLGFFGVLAGLALGQSRFRLRWSLVFATVYGSFAVCWQLGMIIRGDDLLWSERLETLYNRLWIIVTQLINREKVVDSLLFIVLMSVLFWLLGSHAGYSLSRYGNPWWSMMPTGLTLFVIHSFDALISQRTWYLAIYIFFALMLTARMTFLQNQRRWQTVRTALPPHLGLDFTRFAILLVTIIVLFAWTLPALGSALPLAQKAWQPVQFAWNSVRSKMDDFFAPLRSSVELVSEVYGNSMYLGRGAPLGDTQIFAVRAPLGLPSTVRVYWRARVYETYINGQWFSSNTRVRNFLPERDNFPYSVQNGRWLGTFEFIAVNPIATIYTPSQPLWVNQRGQVEYFENPDGTLDLVTFRANPTLSPGYVYQVQASVDYATIAQLRAAGVEYPEWVKERYLQIPTSVTARTRQLAEEITFGLETPYDKVVAVTNYLRKNIKYVEMLKEDAPSNQETLDWFLFDVRKGFCNYYASAEVILLRSVGIPARWATGYATGKKTLDAQTGQAVFTVLQRNAHAWPEVYFPGIGWIEFEPTVSEPEIVRLEGESANPLDRERPQEADEEEKRHQREREELERLAKEREMAASQTESEHLRQQKVLNVVYWIVTLTVFGSLAYLGYRFYKRGGSLPRINLPPAAVILEKAFVRAGVRPPAIVRLWARRAMLPPLAKAYLEINHALVRLRKPPAVTNTPLERAELLAEEIPTLRKPALRLVHEYQVETFSYGKDHRDQPANLTVAIKSAIEIKERSLQATIRRLFERNGGKGKKVAR